MANLTDRLKNLSLRVIGNKVNLAGITLMAAGVLNGFGENEIITFIPTIQMGVGFSIMTSFGSETVQHYRRAMKQIQEYGSIDERYMKTVLNYRKSCWASYCPEQGLYIAARENGQLDDFRRIEKEYSKNKIPHF